MFVTLTEIENAELDTEVLPPLDLHPAGESSVRPPQRRLYEEEEAAWEGLRGDESKEKEEGDRASSTGEEEEEESKRLERKKKRIVTADGDIHILKFCVFCFSLGVTFNKIQPKR